MSYESPVLVLSEDTIRNYANERDWEWIQTHSDSIPDVLDDAASALETLIEEVSVANAIEDAIAYARDEYGDY